MLLFIKDLSSYVRSKTFLIKNISSKDISFNLTKKTGDILQGLGICGFKCLRSFLRSLEKQRGSSLKCAFLLFQIFQIHVFR